MGEVQMSRYDQNQLQTMLAGATPLQSLVGNAPVIKNVMAEIGVQEIAPKPAAPAPAPANTVENFLAPQAPQPGGMA